ncbi:hypothetical protein SAMN05216326_10615 [Nitrosomonas marina]|uniref:Uncharacterized protein n=1 Tax=Nitrosomonas marina TaxID=917 RepID=A0A1I0A323_9PROT|nr:hypothetical protein [Nitrosomonas marina]SES88541.1 hypothetical protein SAMN05216326_10615 [Nitrosomonas marina]
MKKMVVAAFAALFIFGSTTTMASGNLESDLTPVSAEDILNWMNCKGKKPTETVKSMTKTKDGKIVRVKCGDAQKIVADANIPVSEY